MLKNPRESITDAIAQINELEAGGNAVGKLLTNFELNTQVLLDELQAGERIPLIIGRTLTAPQEDESLDREPRTALRR